jgi:arylsulfatase A-like enzyme
MSIVCEQPEETMTASKLDTFPSVARGRVPHRARLCWVFAMSLLAAAACAGQDPPAATDARPNILYIMSDDHAVQAVSAYGHPVSQIAPTPNIDRIAEQGLIFKNAFVTNSLCGPSRAAILTGKYGHLNGFTKNGDTFDGSQWTWPRALKEAGYQTALIGKWHLDRTPAGLEFDYWKIFNDQGEYYNPQVITEGGEQRYEGYASDLVTQFALEWLRERRDPGKPFVLLMHHKAPHRNWMPALRHTRKFEDSEFPVPETYFDDYEGRRAAAAQEMNIYRDMHEGHDLKMTVAAGSTELRYDPWTDHFARMTPEQRAAWDAAYQARNDVMNRADMDEREMALWKYQRYLEQYLATIAAVDESVGAVLDYLDESGLADNTLVVYTSDQGFYLGEHGWFDKRFMYEVSLRTPLLMRLPGRIPAGTSTSAMVMNIDFAPTFLELAGLEPPADIQGRSLTEILEGHGPRDWRQSIYYHYYEYPGVHSVKRHYGVRSDRYKLIHFYYDIDAWEFYDLETDPLEMHNAIDNPDYQDEIEAMRAELQRLRAQYEVPPDE